MEEQQVQMCPDGPEVLPHSSPLPLKVTHIWSPLPTELEYHVPCHGRDLSVLTAVAVIPAVVVVMEVAAPPAAAPLGAVAALAPAVAVVQVRKMIAIQVAVKDHHQPPKEQRTVK